MTCQHEGAAGPDPAPRYRRSDTALWRHTAQGVLILTDADEPFEARGAAVELWHQLTRPSTEPELCTAIALRFRQPVDVVAPLIRRVLRDLHAIGAVTPDETGT